MPHTLQIVSRINREIDSNYRFTKFYSEREASILVTSGQNLGLDDLTIMDLVCAGSRTGKPVPLPQMIQQLNNYVKEVLPRGYPYLFRSAEHFSSFKMEIRYLLQKSGIPTGDVRVHGSSLRSKNAKDVDLLAVLSPEAFQLYRNSQDRKIRQVTEGDLRTIRTAFQLKGLDLLVVAADTYYPNRPYLRF